MVFLFLGSNIHGNVCGSEKIFSVFLCHQREESKYGVTSVVKGKNVRKHQKKCMNKAAPTHRTEHNLLNKYDVIMSEGSSAFIDLQIIVLKITLLYILLS